MAPLPPTSFTASWKSTRPGEMAAMNLHEIPVILNRTAIAFFGNPLTLF